MRFGDPDKRPWPKPWTSSKPPKPFSRRLFDRATVIGLATVAVGIVLMLATVLFKITGFVITLAGIAYLVWYAGRDVVRWFHEERWRNSPGPTDTLDDL